MSKISFKNTKSSYHMQEGIKNLRMNLLFTRDDRKVVVVTSSLASEGKTSTTIELCKSLAQINKKVLLIDADMRKSVMVTRVDGARNVKGLAHFLSGQAKLSEVLTVTEIPNLHVIMAGTTVMNAAELLSSPRFEKMLESLREHYEYIIIDGAPVGLVVDSAIIGKHCDCGVFVVESGKVKYKFIQKAIARLESSDCPVLGVVLNKFDMKKGGDSYYNKYYKEY